jgi:squalene-hopene/tetraprenyl-beta-curcumene cyclase
VSPNFLDSNGVYLVEPQKRQYIIGLYNKKDYHMKKTSLIQHLAVISLLSTNLAFAAEPAPLITKQAVGGKIDLSTTKEAEAALNRGLDWLAAQQKEDGSWSEANFPALTALPLWAFSMSHHPKKAEITAKAAKFIMSNVQADGGIYRKLPGKGGGLSHYNTALCMIALHSLNDPQYTPTVLKARKFIAAGQHFGNDVYEGGMGYDSDTGRNYTDLSDSVIAYESMRLTQSVEDLRDKSEAHVDLDWAAAVRYLDRLQNKASSTNDDNAGGFIYRPDESKAGSTTNKEGVVVFRSYGSMTYAGLLSLIYADVNKNDPRVQSAFDWAAKHWTLDENPGMGDQGLYYFYGVLSKALAAYGRDSIPTKDNSQIMWRDALAKKLIGLQKVDSKTGHGFWVNNNNRFWEANDVLVTSYTLLALEITMGK